MPHTDSFLQDGDSVLGETFLEQGERRSGPQPSLPHTDATAEGVRVMTVCNACRYCEQYCPVFQAMERRLNFASADLNYLANLCHNCGECLYACQYAPPHEFAINVPRALARVRIESYEQYAWPAVLAGTFRRHGVASALLLAAVLACAMLAGAWIAHGSLLVEPAANTDFYAVVPHATMVALFGVVGIFVIVALWIGAVRCARDFRSAVDLEPLSPSRGSRFHALRDALTLRHLQPDGESCTTADNERTPWRRAFHHATFYGFALCFASTCVAAVYHALGYAAPYPLSSVPVLLGTAGGLGLLVGPAGLLFQRRTRDPALSDQPQEQLDRAFIVSLLLTSATGLLLLALRGHVLMSVLLLVHLGIVLALLVTLPYGKFVHGLYRVGALLLYRREERAPARGELPPR
jgi:citrate/tricarballylate utilization protein